jgi:hypothetical protein
MLSLMVRDLSTQEFRGAKIFSTADRNKRCFCLLLKVGGRRKVSLLPCDDPEGIECIAYAEWIANPFEQSQ